MDSLSPANPTPAEISSGPIAPSASAAPEPPVAVLTDLNEQLPALMSEELVATVILKSKRWLQRDRHMGRDSIPFIKVGRAVLYEREAVLAHLAAHRFTNTRTAADTMEKRKQAPTVKDEIGPA